MKDQGQEKVTVSEASRRIRVGRRTIQRWIAAGVLTKAGGKVVLDDLAEVVMTRTTDPRPGPRPGGLHYQHVFRSNGFNVPRAQKRLSDLDRAAKVADQLARVADPYVLEQLSTLAWLAAKLRRGEVGTGARMKPDELLETLRVVMTRCGGRE